MDKDTWLSIDYDFFTWNGVECNGKVSAKNPQTGEFEDVTALHFFDWGHNEAHAPMLLDFLWKTRFEAFRRAGIDPYKVITDHPGVTPINDFVREIEKRFDYSYGTHVVADSHMWGFAVANTAYASMDAPTSVVHFDAHCDLGYSAAKMIDQKAKGIFDCGSWLWHALDQGLVEDATIVYPDWKGTDEWDECKNEVHLKGLDIRVYSYSDWLRVTANAPVRNVEVVFSCRSSSWTAPWLDSRYEDLKKAIDTTDFECLDCQQSNTRYHACRSREWEDPTEPPQALEDLLKNAG